MEELQTISGNPIPIHIRGILYLCETDGFTMYVTQEHLYSDASLALVMYANIPNPASQLVLGETYDELIINLHKLHKNMKDPNWVKDLQNYL